MTESHDASRTERDLPNHGANPRLHGDRGEGVISAAMAVCAIRPPSGKSGWERAAQGNERIPAGRSVWTFPGHRSWAPSTRQAGAMLARSAPGRAFGVLLVAPTRRSEGVQGAAGRGCRQGTHSRIWSRSTVPSLPPLTSDGAPTGSTDSRQRSGQNTPIAGHALELVVAPVSEADL